MLIQVEDLSFTYRNAETPAVHDLSFDVQEGEIFGFLGPSAAGKSTTQKILIGLLREFDGSVSVLGRPLQNWSSDFYENIGVAFEFPNHYLKLTARENLSYFGSLYRRAPHTPQELLERVDLGASADMQVANFSKGMKTRLGVARALLHDPGLIFLDEPTAGLDPVNSRRIRDLISAEKAKGKTVFLTTHDMVTADELCDRVALIIDGSIQLTGAPRDLRLQHGEAKVRVETQIDARAQVHSFPLSGLGRNQAFLDLLRDHPIQTIHSQEATLEDVFVQTTGKNLR